MEHDVAVATVCRVLGASRSTIYARWRRDGTHPGRRGPRCELADDELVELIRRVLGASPFAGEGYRKVRARLRREHGVHVGGKRVLRLMRQQGLLAPERTARRRAPRLHEGSIVPKGPDLRWGTDATLAWTRDDGWVWVFALVDHYTAEAWCHVSKAGDRFAALQPLYDAVVDRFRALAPDVARGIALRHDWGSQYRSHHFSGSLRWLGMSDEPTYPGEPEGNGCAERWIRTLKEQCLWAQLHNDIDDLRQAVADFVELYNTQWLIQRHGHHTPKEAYAAATTPVAA